MGEVVVDAGDGRVGERGQQVGLALEIAHDHLVHGRVGGHVDHFLDRHKLGDVGEVQIPAFVDRAHAAGAEDAEHQVAVLEGDPRLKQAQLVGFTGLVGQGARRSPHRGPGLGWLAAGQWADYSMHACNARTLGHASRMPGRGRSALPADQLERQSRAAARRRALPARLMSSEVERLAGGRLAAASRVAASAPHSSRARRMAASAEGSIRSAAHRSRKAGERSSPSSVGSDFLRQRRSSPAGLPVTAGSPQMPRMSSCIWKARPSWRPNSVSRLDARRRGAGDPGAHGGRCGEQRSRLASDHQRVGVGRDCRAGSRRPCRGVGRRSARGRRLSARAARRQARPAECRVGQVDAGRDGPGRTGRPRC